MESFVILLCSFCSRIWETMFVNVMFLASVLFCSFFTTVSWKEHTWLIYLCTPQKMGAWRNLYIFYELSFFSGYPRSPILVLLLPPVVFSLLSKFFPQQNVNGGLRVSLFMFLPASCCYYDRSLLWAPLWSSPSPDLETWKDTVSLKIVFLICFFLYWNLYYL